MKIIQVVNTLSVADGGPARNSFELNISLNQRPDIVADLFWIHGDASESVVHNYDNLLGELPQPGPMRLGIRRNPRLRVTSLWEFVGKAYRCDVVVVHGYYLGWVLPLALLLMLLRTEFVITPHGSLTLHQQKIAITKKKIYDATIGQIVLRLTSGFVTGSKIEAEELQSKFPASSVQVAGVGTSLPRDYRRSHNWSKPGRLLSLSRIAPKKRIDICIEALAILRANRVDVELDVVGTGDNKLLSELVALANRLKVSDCVHFHGQLSGDAKTQMYLAADIFLLPSDDENFGIGLAEALAHGLPCVASTRVAAAISMSPDSGIVIDSPNGESTAAAVQNILSNFDPFESSLAARACAIREYSWRSAAERWKSALQILIAIDIAK